VHELQRSPSVLAMQTFWNALAALGAVTGVFALGWQVFTWRKSRPSLEVTSAHAYPTYGDHVGDHHISVSATNTGGAATEITGWGLRTPSGSSIFDLHPLPFSDKPGRIEPEARLTFFMEGESIRRTCQQNGIAVSKLRPYVISTTAGEVFGEALNWKDQ